MLFRKEPKEELSAEEKLKRLEDQFERKRDLSGVLAKIARIIAVCMSLYHIVASGIYMIPGPQHKAIHLSFALALVFILYPGSAKNKGKMPWYDLALSLLGVVVGLYIVFQFKELVYRMGDPTRLDIAVGAIALLLVLEATRRTMGWSLVLVALVFVAYDMLGQYLPGPIAHKGYDITRVVEHLYLTSEGIFGVAIYVTSTFVFIFMLLGSFLGVTGGAQSFINLAFSLTGRFRGGPAKAAVVASGLMGMVSGSSFANVAGTGVFTIPLMKSVGYKPEFAGGVEAAASSGGQIMPPIMGAAAFIMAEMIGIPYGKIILYAAIPAVLYYLAVFIMVDLEAAKNGLVGMPGDKLPKFWDTFKKGGFLLLSPVSIVFSLLAGYSAIKSSLIALLILIASSMLKKETRLNLRKLIDALDAGARSSLGLIVACATAGIIVGSVTLTGMGLKFADLIVTIANGQLLPALVLTMIAAIIMGMGMPTTALYIILGAMVAPAIVKMGVPVVAAHLFIFYYGCFAAVTPPVALSSYLAASIARADPTKTALHGLKLSSAALLLPFIFAYSPKLLLLDTTFSEALITLATAAFGILALGCGLEGFMIRKIRWPARITLLAAAVLLIYPGKAASLSGAALMTAVAAVQFITRNGKTGSVQKGGAV